MAVRRASLLWLGHVARIPTDSPQKQVMFGWVEGNKAKVGCPFKQAQWLSSCLRQAHIPEMDRLHLAQNKSEWKKQVLVKQAKKRARSVTPKPTDPGLGGTSEHNRTRPWGQQR